MDLDASNKTILGAYLLSAHRIDDIRRLESSPLRFPNHIGIAPAIRAEHVDIDRHICGTFLQLTSRRKSAMSQGKGLRRRPVSVRLRSREAKAPKASKRRSFVPAKKPPSNFWLFWYYSVILSLCGLRSPLVAKTRDWWYTQTATSPTR